MPVPEGVEKLQPRLARDEAYASLRGWIVEGTLEPGERLRDSDLAAALGVSRMPVREALRRLEDEGLVQSSASRWTRVADLDTGQAENVYPILWLLEALALSSAEGSLTRENLEEMEEANARLERALAKGDAVGASRADGDFHRVFVERCANAELIRIVADMKAKVRRLETAYFGEDTLGDRSLAEHREIVEALRAGDRERAAELVKTNWRASLERFRQYEDAG